MLRWRYYTAEAAPWDWYAQIDEVLLDNTCTPLSSGGLLTGTVYIANTERPFRRAKSPTMKPARQKQMPHGMYVLYSSAGTKNVTATGRV